MVSEALPKGIQEEKMSLRKEECKEALDYMQCEELGWIE